MCQVNQKSLMEEHLSHGTLLQSWSHLEAASPRGNDVQSQGSALLKSEKMT